MLYYFVIVINARATSYKYIYFFIIASLESARKSAADSNYQTTDEDKLGRGKRQHTSHNRYSSEEEESDNYVHRPYKIKSMY